MLNKNHSQDLVINSLAESSTYSVYFIDQTYSTPPNLRPVSKVRWL